MLHCQRRRESAIWNKRAIWGSPFLHFGQFLIRARAARRIRKDQIDSGGKNALIASSTACRPSSFLSTSASVKYSQTVMYSIQKKKRRYDTLATLRQVVLSMHVRAKTESRTTNDLLTTCLHDRQLTAPHSAFSHLNSFSCSFSITTL